MAHVSETLTDPLIGRVIDGRYEVRERVAAGGNATRVSTALDAITRFAKPGWAFCSWTTYRTASRRAAMAAGTET